MTVRTFAAIAAAALAGVASAAPMKQSEAVQRLLNSASSQGPVLFEAAAERVDRDAKAGMPLQRFIMAVHPDLPEKYRLDEETRKQYIESARPRILMLAEQRENPLAWYLLALESDDIALLEKAANGGNIQALNVWGTHLLDRAGEDAAAGRTNEVAQTLAKAVECFKAAAKKEDPNGLYNLGMCYVRGAGVDADEALAFQCFRTAAEAGHPEAINSLGGCYRDGIAVERDLELSAKWFAKSAELGDPYGKLNYALALQHGEGVARDEAAAARLVGEAARQGCAEAMNVYGMCYFHGLGVAHDPMMAVAWFERSAAAGFPPALGNLAECYERGAGVEKSSRKSMVWKMRFRAARGDKAAAEWLSTMDGGGE